MTLLERVMPAYEVHEVHRTIVRASPAAIHRALFTVRSDEIALFGALLTVRGLRRPGADVSRPVIESARQGGFAILADHPDRELVLGVIGRFWRLRDRDIRAIASEDAFASFHEPGYARAAMNFLIEPEGDGRCRLTTETRVDTTDAHARRAFRIYWTFVHPGSAFIRRMWLRALKRRAERAEATRVSS